MCKFNFEELTKKSDGPKKSMELQWIGERNQGEGGI